MKKNNLIAKLALYGLMLLAPAESAFAQEYIYVYKNGVIRYRDTVENVDSVAMEQDKSVVTLYDAQHKPVYSSPRTEVDSISLTTTVPQADLLDIRFLDDGTADDISPRHMKVETVGNSQTVCYSDTYKRNIAAFANPWAGKATGYYKVSYETNASYCNALADGHSLELLFMASYGGTIANSEAKPFSSHQAGGTGFLISTISGNRKNEITFLPNVSTSGSSTWRWATSGVVPQSMTYYHVVGVWNKAEGKAYIYVNGELKNKVDATGSLIFPSTDSKWFGIGCDPDGMTGNNGWSGNIVLARVYDDPLNADQVTQLWGQVKVLQDNAVPDMITNVSFLSGIPINAGGTFCITANGFEEGDELQVISLDKGTSITVPVTLTADGCSFVIPDGFTSGAYRLVAKRGTRTQTIGTVELRITDRISKGMRVIAHRGHWNVGGSAQNSRSSLQNAMDLKCYGSETDVWITTDGHVMVNHDASLNGVTIETSTYDTCSRLKLSNGEAIPELHEFLDQLATQDSTRLIIEIKTHASEARGKACIDSVLAQVKARGLEEKVEYIAFSSSLCRYIVSKEPTAHVAYLNGDLAPSTLYNWGVMGLDYTAASYRSNPTWAAQARKLGMTTNVWTIDDLPTMIEMANMGIDYVTTNNPETAKLLYEHYAANHVPGTEDLASCDSAFANLLDIRFNADGSVEDVSPMHHEVKVVSEDNRTVPVEYVPELDAYAGHFANPWGGAPSTYCRVDYSDDYDFIAALADGHTLETVFCAEFDGTIANKEAKWFSSHQAGGTGFLISTISGSRQNEITFLPNVSTTGSSTWKWANSGIIPESGKYYHVVGVWNAEEGRAYIYVNGEQRKSLLAEGNMILPSDGARWFGIGCDPASNTNGEASGNWRIVSARIYDKALTPEEVEKLW